MRALRMRSVVAGHQMLTTTSWEHYRSLILLQLHKNLPKNSVSIILWLFGIWSKLKRWKCSINGCLMSWPQILKIIVLKCHLFLFYATTKKTISQLDCDLQQKVGFIWQLGTTSTVFGLRRSSKTLPKAKLAPWKGSWSLFGGMLLVLIH